MQRQSVRNLPANKNPTGTRCITLEIPDDDDWERAIFSEAYRLGIWALWERDPTKSGAPVARRWREALQTWRHCDGTPSPVHIIEWEEELSLKCNIRWCNGELQVLDCDEWVPVMVCDDGPNPIPRGQPEAQPRPGPGTSKCFLVELQANSQWKAPFPVQDGDTVTVSNISGGWNDGTLDWFCAEGKYFSFGNCYGGQIYDGGDPATYLYHMELMLAVNGAFWSASAGPVVIPTSTGIQELIIRANDASLSDNSGSLTFQVCIENGSSAPTADWTHVFDFTVSEAGWVPVDTTPQDSAVYDAGQGWTENNIALGDGVYIRSPNMSNSGVIKSMSVEADGIFEGTNPHMKISTVAGVVFDAAGDHASPYPIDLSSNTDMWPWLNLLFDPYVGSGESWPHHFTKVTISGTGSDPFL